MPTTVGVNDAFLRKQTAGACGQPPTVFPPTPTNPAPSLSAICPWPPCCRWILLGIVSLWLISYPCPWRSYLIWIRYAGLLPRYSWSVLVIIPVVPPEPAGPGIVKGFPQIPPLHPSHPHTMSGWREGVRLGAFGWEIGPLFYIYIVLYCSNLQLVQMTTFIWIHFLSREKMVIFWFLERINIWYLQEHPWPLYILARKVWECLTLFITANPPLATLYDSHVAPYR